MTDYELFVDFMLSWQKYEFATNVNPFFVVEGEYEINGMEIL